MVKKIICILISITFCFSKDNNFHSSLNDFGFSLFQEIHSKTKTNVLISPLSISCALMMVSYGSVGSTLDNILSTLNLSSHNLPYYHNNIHRYIKRANKDDFIIGNSIWIQSDGCYSPNKDYVSFIDSVFNGQISYVNFYKDRLLIIDQINNWVNKKTYGLIDEIVSEEHIKPNTKQALLNTVYFKSNWQSPFDSSKTKVEVFFKDKRNKIDLPMMNRQARYFHYKNKNFHLLDIPYSKEDISMLIILPNQNESLDNIIALLNHNILEESINQFKFELGNIWIPKFKIDFSSSLKDYLKLMGMNIPFNPRLASFDKFWNYENECKKNPPRHYIDVINHKTHINLDESGTEAASATAIVINRVTSINPNLKPFLFKADKPFLYLIYDKKDKNILFLGKYVGE